MSDDQLGDLKQFIDSRISQSEARLDERIDDVDKQLTGVQGSLTSLERKVEDGFAGVGAPIAQHNDELADHEHRITKLEQQAV